MVKRFTLSQQVIKNDRGLCPDCVNHEQGRPVDFHDCKNEFFDRDGATVSQCCCYGPAHGKREW